MSQLLCLPNPSPLFCPFLTPVITGGLEHKSVKTAKIKPFLVELDNFRGKQKKRHFVTLLDTICRWKPEVTLFEGLMDAKYQRW